MAGKNSYPVFFFFFFLGWGGWHSQFKCDSLIATILGKMVREVSWMNLLGSTLDHEMENLKESRPISFIRAISSWNKAKFSYQINPTKKGKWRKYILFCTMLDAQGKVK